MREAITAIGYLKVDVEGFDGRWCAALSMHANGGQAFGHAC